MRAGPDDIRLKTWSDQAPVRAHEFYMLAKGFNAGRPMDKPCPNCFVVPCKTEEQREHLFGLSLALFQAGGFRYYLCGTAVQFIHIRHAEGLLNHAYKKFKEQPEEHLRQIETLRKLDALEKARHQELDMIRKLKVSLARKHFGDHPDLHDRGKYLAR